MLRTQVRASVWAALASFVCAGVAHAESFTTRIEPRPLYGAVITREAGVRVIRPLPPVRQVIINPNGTPLSLGFNDTRVYEQTSIYNQDAGGAEAGNNGDIVYGAPYGGFGRGLHHGRGRAGDHFGNHHGFNHGVGGFQGR